MSQTSKPKHIRPAIRQHKDLLLDKRYHHKTEASRKARTYGEVERLYRQELKDYLNESRQD